MVIETTSVWKLYYFSERRRLHWSRSRTIHPQRQMCTPAMTIVKITQMDQTATMTFANLRVQLWWRFGELLADESPYKIALSPDSRLTADLTRAADSMPGESISSGNPKYRSDWAGATAMPTPSSASIRNPVISLNVTVHASLGDTFS